MRKIADLCLANSAGLAEMVRAENQHQLDKWGVQETTPAEWLMYLGEEQGELCEAVAEFEYRDGKLEHVVREAIQVATLALKIAEMYLWPPLEEESPATNLQQPQERHYLPENMGNYECPGD